MLHFKAAVGHGLRWIAALGVWLLLAASPLLPPKPAVAVAQTYYVATNGSDTPTGGTLAKPWRTIQYAANHLSPGDTVYIRAGTYHEHVTPPISGTVGAHITYAAYPGEVPTLDGSGVPAPPGYGPEDLSGLFEITGLSYLRVAGVRITNANWYTNTAGLLVYASSYITVEAISTYNTASSGIGVWGSDHITVDGNRVDEAGVGGTQESISVDGTDTFVVRNNTALNCHNEGICIKNGSSNGQVNGNNVHDIQKVGIYVDAYANHTFNIDVFQNIVHDNHNDGIALASELGGLLENIHVYNNLSYHNQTHGLNISTNGTSAMHPMTDVYVLDNTFYNNGWTWGGGIGLYDTDAQNVVIRNNIASQNLTFQIAAPGVPTQTAAIDYNLIDGFRGYDGEGEVWGSNYVKGLALFVNAANADFHLLEASPAIDRGTPNDAPLVDFDGRPRPLDGNCDLTAAYDIGAYEMPCLSARVFLPLRRR